MCDAAIDRNLDAIVTILRLAYRDELAEARQQIRSEPGKAALLDAATTWSAAGPLVAGVAKAVKKSPRSVRNYVGELVELGVLEKRGGGRSTEYRSSGVI